MSTTVPPVHIAVMGIEKVVERLEHVPPLLSLLTRSATGQHITTYFNMITSPRKPGEKDGPTSVHLVLLDNGRSRILQDPVGRDVLKCIRCGCCLNVCPVYKNVGGYAYGWFISGPIGAIFSPQMLGTQAARELVHGASDGDGYFQIDVAANDRVTLSSRSGHSCQLVLKAMQPSEGFSAAGKVMCQ